MNNFLSDYEQWAKSSDTERSKTLSRLIFDGVMKALDSQSPIMGIWVPEDQEKTCRGILSGIVFPGYDLLGEQIPVNTYSPKDHFLGAPVPFETALILVETESTYERVTVQKWIDENQLRSKFAVLGLFPTYADFRTLLYNQTLNQFLG